MSRISLVEAYDNRDVIGQLVRLREDVNELQAILENIDPDGDLTNFVTKTGDETIAGIKTFVGKIVADCDIIQNGAAYETHAEQVYSKNDYIVMRDEAVAGLAPGTYSGLHVKKYNGVDDARLVVDRDGVARVGDVNDEQPLMTRDEVADMTSGNILSWDGVNKKAITSGTSVTAITGDISTLQNTVAGKVSGTGNIGSNTKPVKIVNGEAMEVTNDLLYEIAKNSGSTGGIKLSNGLIINWGVTSSVTMEAGTGGNADVTFAIPFSSTNYQMTANLGATPTYFGQVVFGTFSSLNSSGRITWFNGAPGDVNMVFRYIAIGL